MMWHERAPGVYEGIAGIEEELDTLDVLIKISNLPLPTRETHRFSRWKHAVGTEAALEEVKLFLEQPKHPFLGLLGGTGCGKTHLAISLAWDWLETRKGAVLYYQVESFLDELRRGYRAWERGDDADPYLLLAQAKACHLFVLDDLGAHKVTEWSSAKLDEIVDYRYINRKPTVVTANLSLDLLPERIADRMAEGVVVVLEAGSYRRDK
jgi:DNA replication protein DnaC